MSNLLSRKVFLVLALVIIVVLGVASLELTGTTHIFRAQPAAPVQHPTAGQNTKGEHPLKTNTNDSTSPTSPTANLPQNEKTNGSASTALLSPTGNFVSNHHPNLSGQPAPNLIQSVCNSTAGATCQIVFTKDTVVKSLPAQIVDQGGATYWTWKLQTVGLTTGVWHIQAVASLGGQNKTADDAMDLEVAP